MATRNWFDSLSQELRHIIFARVLASADGGASETTPLAAIRLTCQAWAIAGLPFVRTLRVRDATEVHHLRRIVDQADDKVLRSLDARLSDSNKGAPAIVEELGRHAWEQMHLEGAARSATVWVNSLRTLTKLSTNNWGLAFRASAQEEAWEDAGVSGDFSYFESIAGFPMLDASLMACKCLREVELILDPLNLSWHLRFVPRRQWRLDDVRVLTVKLGRLEQDGEPSFEEILGRRPHSRYMKGFELLSGAFPQVEHVKLPEWGFPLGIDVRQRRWMDRITGWQGVRILELGRAGLPYTFAARVCMINIVMKLQVNNWPDLETLIISGTHCADIWPAGIVFRGYMVLLEADRPFLKKLKELIIESTLR